MISKSFSKMLILGAILSLQTQTSEAARQPLRIPKEQMIAMMSMCATAGAVVGFSTGIIASKAYSWAKNETGWKKNVGRATLVCISLGAVAGTYGLIKVINNC